MDIENYLGLFIDESKENLQVLNQNLLKLEKEPENTETLNEIFRVAHTFKGMSKTMGFNFSADLTHNMENLLEPLRTGEKKATGKIIDLLFSCLDSLEKLVDSVTDKGAETEDKSVNKLIKNLQKEIDSKESPSLESDDSGKLELNEYELNIIEEAKKKGLHVRDITVYFENECVLPGVRAYMVNNSLEPEGEVIKYSPTVEEIEAGNFLSTKEYNSLIKLLFVTNESDDDILNLIMNISEIAKVEINEYSEPGKEKKVTEDTQQEEEKEVSQATKTVTKATNQTVRVSSQRLDKLMNLVGELVINKTRIYELSSKLGNDELISSAGAMESITGEVQEIVMKLRMVPVDQVFSRFPRLVRDISKSLGKSVSLELTGKDIEVDRAVVDEIGDPLVHLIRNSLDHGIETTEDRIKAGKPAKGIIELQALNEGDNILIKITDDGKGIDPEIIKNKAISKGFITEDDAKKLTESEILDFILKPGFSTVEVATDLSGRGVGMDVVKSKISALNGLVNISSTPGKGTEITITLPSTMAIIQALLIYIGKEIYALPLSYINEVIDIYSKDIKVIRNREVLDLRGKTIPLIRMNELLETPDYEENPDKPLTVVIIKSRDKYIGLSVTELLGQQEVVIKTINKKLCEAQYISGATTLGNGEVALILNVNNLN